MKKLLVVDNSSIILNILIDLFSKNNNFEIFIAKSFKEAKEYIETHDFFASISNLVLPDALNGELLELLDKSNIPTLVLTSKIDDETIKTVKKNNVVDYITKDSIYELKSAYRLIKLLVFTDGLEVLIVDDSMVISAQIKRILETLLLKVHTAKSGLEALDLLKDNPNISFVFSDYHMKEMDGLELIKNIRKSENHSNIPTIIMTTDDSDELKIRFYKSGATDFLTKPILEEELKAKVINIFKQMNQVQELKTFNQVIDENVITSSTDSNGIITKVSKAFCKIAGYEKSELIGKTHSLVRHPEMPKSLYEELWKTIKSGKKWKGEIKNSRKNGTYYWVKVIIEPNIDKRGHISGFTSVRQDITDKKRIYELSITDGLTSLYNRRYFNDIAQSSLEDRTRTTSTFGFLILDIDNFKKYNDTYGHQKGDDVLISVSKSLQDTFKRNDDKVFRLGGEEFGVIFSTKEKDDVLKLANNARNNIKFLNIEHEKNPPLSVITASFGLVIITSDEELKLDDIYKLADEKLYEAKENGRNRIEYSEL